MIGKTVRKIGGQIASAAKRSVEKSGSSGSTDSGSRGMKAMKGMAKRVFGRSSGKR
jgi:hypothetical protein